MRRRNRKMTVRLNDSEWILFEKNYSHTDLSRQDFCLSLLLGREIPPTRHPDLASIRRELNAIGNNINQLARAANSGYRVPREDMLIIERSFSDLEAKLMEVLKGGRPEE